MGEWIYLDHAATSFPKSPAVTAAVLDCLSRAGGNPGRSGHPLSLAADATVFEARCAVSALCGGGDPSRVIFTPGATFAINLAISVYLGRHGRVLISDMEHNAVWRTAVRYAEERGAAVSVFRAGDLADFERRLSSATLAVTLHASNVTGDVYPAEEMAALCRRYRVPLILDAAQSAGHLPLDGIGADVICLPGHKALGGIQGAGAAVFRDGRGLAPFLCGGSGSHSLSAAMPPELPDRYEAGTPPTPAIAAMGAGVREVLARGDDGWAEKLAKTAAEMLSAIPGVSLLGSGDRRVGIVAFTLRGMPSETLAARLADEGICVRGGFHCAAQAHRTLGTDGDGCVRLSFGRGNTEDELPALRDAVRKLAEG